MCSFVCASSAQNAGKLSRLRSYSSDHAQIDDRITVWQAARATLASRSFFEPITINRKTYTCATTASHSTCDEVWKEAQSLWANQEVDLRLLVRCSVSLGAGDMDLQSVEESTWRFATKKLSQIALESRKGAEDFQRVHSDIFRSGCAFRFNVNRGLNGIGAAEHERAAEVLAATTEYMKNQCSVEQVHCVNTLADKENPGFPASCSPVPSDRLVPSLSTESNSARDARSSSDTCNQPQNSGHNFLPTHVADHGHLHQGDQHNHFHYYYSTDSRAKSRSSQPVLDHEGQSDGNSTPQQRQKYHASSVASGDRKIAAQARRSLSRVASRENGIDSSQNVPISIMPYELNSRFINRPDEMQALSLCFFSEYGSLGDRGRNRENETTLHRRAALYGLSGVGKTQLANSFAHRYRKVRPDHSIFWIHASTEEWLRQSFQKLADACDIEVTTEGKADVFSAVAAWLKNETTRPWLMILDNADDAKMLFHTRRRLADAIAECPHGALLVTTRNKKVAEKITFYGETIHVKEMSQEQSVELMNAFLGAPLLPTASLARTTVSPVVQELVKHLERLPLAVAQAAAYIKENSITVKQYLDMWKESAENAQELLSSEFEADGRQHFDASVPNAVGTTMMLSLDHLQEARPRTGHLLIVVSFFHHTSIRPFLLLESDERQSSPAFVEAMGDLQAFSLMSRNTKDENYEMHRLVHHVTCKWRTTSIPHQKVEAAARFALDRLNQAFPTTMGKIDRQEADAYLPHALRFLHGIHKLGIAIEARNKFKLMQKVAEHLLYQGRVLESKTMREEALALCELSPEVAKAGILRAKCELAEVLEQLHYFEQAKIICQDIIYSVSNSGKLNRPYINSLRIMARISTREKAHRQALQQAREAKSASSEYLGKHHEETLILDFAIAEILENFAQYCDDKREELLYQARDTLQQAIEDLTKQKGPDASTTILGKQHLSNVLDELGQLEESKVLCEEIISSKRRTLGDHDLETFKAVMNLAFCHIKQADHERAERLVQYAMQTTSPAVNNHHLGRAKGLQILAMIHNDRGEQWRQKIPVTAVAVHQDLDVSADSTVTIAKQTGSSGSSREILHADDYHSPSKTPVYPSPRAVKQRKDFGSTLVELVEEDQHKASPRPNPPTDPQAVLYEKHALEEFQKALHHQIEVVNMLLAAPGIEHPDTVQHILDTTKSLTRLFISNPQAFDAEGEQAEKWQKDVLEVQLDLLGEKHEDTIATKGLLAATLHRKGRPEEAEPFAYSAFKDRVARLGKSHPDTLDMHQMLAEIMNMQSSSRKESIELLHSCWQLSLKALGAHNTDTKLRLALWQQWKEMNDTSTELFTATNSMFTTVPSASTSRIFEGNGGMTKLLTHNTLHFSVMQSHKLTFTEGGMKRAMIGSPVYKSTRVIGGFNIRPERTGHVV